MLEKSNTVLKLTNRSLIAIALANNTVEIWNESERVETLATNDQVIAMRFGRYNREDATLGNNLFLFQLFFILKCSRYLRNWRTRNFHCSSKGNL